MILLRLTEPYSDDQDEVSFSGPDEEALYKMLCSVLIRLGWEIEVSIDDDEFVPVEDAE